MLFFCAFLDNDLIVFFFRCVVCCCFCCLLVLKGLADAFIKMRLPFESDEACKLNKDIFETIYFGAVNASVEVKLPFCRFGACARVLGEFVYCFLG